MIYISSDHRGFELKNYLVLELKSNDIEITDLGPEGYNPDDDYPKFAEAVAKKTGENPENLGILICANGVGISIAANKFKGIRAGLSWTPDHARSSRNDDGTNILVLPADYVSHEEALEIVQAWLSTNFSGEDRHLRRLMQISALERN